LVDKLLDLNLKFLSLFNHNVLISINIDTQNNSELFEGLEENIHIITRVLIRSIQIRLEINKTRDKDE
jgi:hypothetical protein